jgi:hypothetical protein
MNAFRTFAAAALFVSAPALAGHTLWSTQGLYIGENGGSAPASNVNMVISWNENPASASASFSGQASGNTYDFNLVGSSVSSVTSSSITGLWNIQRNGVLVCTGCAGTAYGLNAAVGTGIKFYDASYKFHFSAVVTARHDW